MAEFCKQCSERLFGKDFQDFTGLTTTQDEKDGKAAVVLCEGCGTIQVDTTGKCVSKDCLDPNHDGDVFGVLR